MSTQIKKNGNWVTVAGGTRMWVGTKAALQAALDAGELADGTTVMVTDDYEESSYPHPDWANAVAIPNNGTAGWTAPEDGIICGGWGGSQAGTGSGSIDSLKVNDVIVASSYRYPNNNNTVSIPVNKGDVLTEALGQAAYWNVSFVPWK